MKMMKVLSFLLLGAQSLKLQSSLGTEREETCTTEMMDDYWNLESRGWSFSTNDPNPTAWNENGLYYREACGINGNYCYMQRCGGSQSDGITSFYMHSKQQWASTASKRLTGSGRATVSFGNCWTDGKVNVYKNGELQGSALPQTFYNEASFDFVDNDLLEVKDDEGNSITFITSLKICTGGASAAGDPHLLNIKGEKFNIARQGSAQLVNVNSDGTSHLEVVALIEGNRRCGKKMFITEVNASGSWLEKNVAVIVGSGQEEAAFRVMVDGQEVWSPASRGYVPPSTLSKVFNHADKFYINEMPALPGMEAQVALELQTAYDVKMKISRPMFRASTTPHLNFDIHGLTTLPHSLKLGGLLGLDDHSNWVARDKDCASFAHSTEAVEGSVAQAH